MIGERSFPLEPWAVRETKLELDRLAQAESLFALSNGHIGWRANLDEGEPHVISGSYLNAFYENVPLPYAETAYGYPEAGQTIVNITDGKLIRLLVDDEPFDMRYGSVQSHERVLDLKQGVLERTTVWESPSHRTVRVHTTRLVSLVHRAVAAVLYEVEPLDQAVDIVVQSELVANEPMTGVGKEDPRAAQVIDDPLVSEFAAHTDRGGLLIHSTRRSRLWVAAAMDHLLLTPRGAHVASEAAADRARVTITARVRPGTRLRFVKLVAYGWSSLRSVPALRSQVEGALASATGHGWKGLARAQREYLADFWSRADVEIDGDDEVQQAIRFALFHILQSAARAEQRAIPAKGLTGPGYDGHSFWDTETFVLHALTYTAPDTVADVLRWRYSILDLARQRARDLGLRGAAFPWRTIHGEECSGYWPASTAAFHINADIADAVLRYITATDDRDFERRFGTELLVETARLWRSLGHFDHRHAFRIDGVTGPDEYSAVMDNNVYTNLMAQRNLQAASDAARRHPDVARRLKVTRKETAEWRKAAAAVFLPFDVHLGVHKQATQFTDHERWDFSRTGPDSYPLFLHYPYFDLYRKQVIKQADLVLAMHLRGDAFTAEQKRRNFEYYEELTVRDSSLSSCTQSIMAAEVGLLQLAHDYLGEAALMDLGDLEHNVRDGLHMGSLAGAWLAVVAGLGGLRHHADHLHFAPRLPPAITRLSFRLTFLGRLIKVDVDHRRATYTLVRGRPISFAHHGETVRLGNRKPVVRRVPALHAPPSPKQPAGREPAHRAPARKERRRPRHLRQEGEAQHRRNHRRSLTGTRPQ